MSDPREVQDEPEEILDDTPPVDPEEGEESDAPEEDAEGVEDDADGDEPEAAEAAPAARKKQSANERIRKINDDLKRERELRMQAEARAAARLEVQAHQSAQQQAAEAAEEARLVQAMTPEERAIYNMAKGQRQQQTEIQQMRAQLFDSSDRSAFIAKYAADPRFSHLLDDVETRAAQLRAQGVPIQREAVLKFLIGERAMSAPAKKAAKVQRSAATERRQAAQGNTRGGGRSDTGRTSSRPTSTVARMEMENGAV